MSSAADVIFPCDNTTQVCTCAPYMGDIDMNSTDFNAANLYKCGVFNAVARKGPDASQGLIYAEDTAANITGWDCGKGEKRMYLNSTNYSEENIYRCGYNSGLTKYKTVKNAGFRTLFDLKLWTCMTLLLFCCLSK